MRAVGQGAKRAGVAARPVLEAPSPNKVKSRLPLKQLFREGISKAAGGRHGRIPGRAHSQPTSKVQSEDGDQSIAARQRSAIVLRGNWTEQDWTSHCCRILPTAGTRKTRVADSTAALLLVSRLPIVWLVLTGQRQRHTLPFI